MKIKPQDELLVFWLIAVVIGLPAAAVVSLVFHAWALATVVAWVPMVIATVVAFWRQDRRHRR